MPYSFNPFSGNFDNTPSTLKGDTAYSNVLSNSADWTDGYQTGTIYKANSASYATIDFTNSKFFPLTGGLITGDARINGNVTIFGDLTSTGTQTFANTVFTTTSSLSIVHIGSGPAFWVGSNSSGDIASFNDLEQGIEVLHVGGASGDFPNVGVKTSSPNKDFTVSGEISASNTIWDANGNSNQWNSVYSSYNTASSSIATNSYVNSNFLPLSGGTMTGRLSAVADAASAKLNIGNAITGGSSNPTDTINGDVWINSGSRLAYKSNSSVYTLALTNSPNAFTTTQSIDLSSNTVALRITQRGAGEALRVEDDTTPDSTAFIVGSDGTVGIGLSSLSGIDSKLTVIGNISSTGVIYASGGKSDEWNSAYSTVLANSAANWNYQGTDLKELSSGWVGGNDAFTNLVSNSAAYLSAVDLSFLSVSGNWDSAYSTVQSNSASWNYQGTDLKDLSGSWQNTYTDFSSNSASYATSSFIQGNFLPLSGGVVNGPLEAGTGSVTLFISGNTVGVNTELPNEALTVVGNISSNSIVYSNDGNSNQWNSVYSSVASNSASYATIDFANNKFFALTGGRIDGNVTIFGDLTSTGTQTFANTIFSTTSSLSVVHIGTGPAVWVGNNGSGDIASFNDIDQGIEMLHVGGVNSTNPNVGVKTSTPNKTFTVNGEISASETIYDNQGNSSQWNSAFTNQTNYLPLSGGTMTGKLTAWHSSTEAGLNIGANTVPTNPVNGDIWLDGNTIKYRENSFTRSLAKTNGVNIFSSYQSIQANDTNNPSLSTLQNGNGGGMTILNQGDGTGLKITSTGSGFALRIEDEPSVDATSFVVDNSGNVGIGLTSAQAISANKLTVVGNISATGVISASASNIKVNVVNASTSRTFTDADNNKVVHIDTTTTPLCAIFPSSLSNGFNVAIMNTGTNDLVLSAAQLNSAGITIPTRYGGAFVYKDSNNLFAVGRLI